MERRKTTKRNIIEHGEALPIPKNYLDEWKNNYRDGIVMFVGNSLRNCRRIREEETPYQEHDREEWENATRNNEL